MSEVNIQVEFAPNSLATPEDLYADANPISELVEDLSEVIYSVAQAQDIDHANDDIEVMIFIGGHDEASQFYQVRCSDSLFEQAVADQIATWYQDGTQEIN
jgi:hypothetical protein